MQSNFVTESVTNLLLLRLGVSYQLTLETWQNHQWVQQKLNTTQQRIYFTDLENIQVNYLVAVLNFLTNFTEPKPIQQRLCHVILTHTLIIKKISIKFVKTVPVSLRVGKMQLTSVIISFLIQGKTTLYDTAKVFVQYKSYQHHRSNEFGVNSNWH